jgi:hypothetical protein
LPRRKRRSHVLKFRPRIQSSSIPFSEFWLDEVDAIAGRVIPSCHSLVTRG